MCNLYYPYFKIEEETKTRYNHKRDILLLALVSSQILIPARHILEMDNDKFDILLKLKKLFDKGVIYSRIPEGYSNLLGYYQDRKKYVVKNPPEVTDIRIDRIVNELYIEKEKFTNYKEIEQQGYYSLKFKRFIFAYKEKHKGTKGLEKIEKYILKNKKNDKLNLKEEIDPYLDNLRKNNEISLQTYKVLKKASDVLYFIAGASTQQLKVCLNLDLISNGIEEEMNEIISDYTHIMNNNYSPERIIERLIELGIIDEKEKFDNITVDEILYLRNLKCFKKFVKKYEKESEINNNEKYFENQKQKLKYLDTVKYTGIELILMIITAAISWIFFKSFLLTLVATIVFNAIVSLFMYLWKKRYHYEIPFLEGFVDGIVELIDPATLYLSKVKWVLARDNN